MTQITTANFLKTTRQYFWSKNFTEVEVNYFNESLPLEPNLYTFKVNDRYLPVSPEFALKGYLAQNQSNCFSIAHCFRNLESTSPQHTPEFLMLEWYLINQNLEALKTSVQNYISQFISCQFVDFVIPPTNFDNEPDFNQYFLNEIEPQFPSHGGVFITGYPSFLAPLSIPNRRFELYINGIEIANGCEENRDSESIKSAFSKEQQFRATNHLPVHPISTDFINNCSLLPPCSGVGLGLNRLFTQIK